MSSFYALSFNVKNAYDRYLFKIFENIDICAYNWLVEIADTIDGKYSIGDGSLFEQDIMSGNLFYDCISKDEYYIISLNVRAYKDHIVHEQIRFLEDFCKSKCEILLLCIDVTEFIFLCKDNALFEQVQKNCNCYGFENIKLLNE